MKRETMIWTVLFAIGAVCLIARAIIGGGLFGTAYVAVEEKQFVNVGAGEQGTWVDFNSSAILDHPQAMADFEAIPEDDRISWLAPASATPADFEEAEAANPGQDGVRFSLWRTVGIWLAAFFTLAIFSFLYKDNPLYKIAEAVVVGVSAAYWMVVGFWDVLVPNLIARLAPDLVKGTAMPGLSGEAAEQDLLYLVPLVLGVMLLWRLAPVGAWIARWPLAFIIGTTAGIRLVGFIQADFLSQIRNTIVPLVAVENGAFDAWGSIKNLLVVLGVLTCLVYFFFSIEHKGVMGKTARVGIWVLMITFGAGFGYTVMGRIALLAIRIEFLFDDWLWIIDPTGKRAALIMFGL